MSVHACALSGACSRSGSAKHPQVAASTSFVAWRARASGRCTRLSHNAQASPGPTGITIKTSGQARTRRTAHSAAPCLYGLTEAAVLAAGYAPSIGFLHRGSARAFVYDIADLYKFETVVPIAFQEASKGVHNLERRVRTSCRDVFRTSKLVSTLIPSIHDVLAVGGIAMPEESLDANASQISEARIDGDAGHRS